MACRPVAANQLIIWVNHGILLIQTLETNFIDILSEWTNIFIEENACENVVFEMAANLSRP